MLTVFIQVILGISNFLVVSIGGTLMGLVWGLATGMVTKFTDHVRGNNTPFHRYS